MHRVCNGLVLAAGLLIAPLAWSQSVPGGLRGPVTAAPPIGGAKIKHVIIIMQENRSFDEYFGGYGLAGYTGDTHLSPSITNMPTTSGLRVGDYIAGSGIPVGATVASVGASSITLSTSASAASSGVTLASQQVNGLSQVVWPSNCSGGPSTGITGRGIPISGSIAPSQTCYAPFLDHTDVSALGGHGPVNAQSQLNDGVTTFYNNGYISDLNGASGISNYCTTYRQEPADTGYCETKAGGTTGISGIYDVMGYAGAADVPNYWAWGQHYTILDNFFEGVRGWSLPSHIEMIAEWVGYSSITNEISDNTTGDPANCVGFVTLSCQTALTTKPKSLSGNTDIPYANLFQHFDTHNITWSFYKGQGTTPDCIDGAQQTCPPQLQNVGTVQGIWDVSAAFNWVNVGGCGNPVCGGGTPAAYASSHIKVLNDYLTDVEACNLPGVAWVVPSGIYSEHPPARIVTGMEYVTSLVNAIMTNPPCPGGELYYDDTVIFILWDDWGGAYDHVLPPNVQPCADGSGNGSAIGCQASIFSWGLRVPAIMISAYQTPGSVYHGYCAFACVATFIEDELMTVPQRLNPTNANLIGSMAVPTTATLVGSITNVATTLVVNDGSQFPGVGKGVIVPLQFLARIDSEIMSVGYTAGNDNLHWTIWSRGLLGTATAGHSNGATITRYYQPGGTGSANAPSTPDTRTIVEDALKGNAVPFCPAGNGCPGGAVTVGDLTQAGDIAANLFTAVPTATPITLSTHIPTGLVAACAGGNLTAGISRACNPTGSAVTLTWESIAQVINKGCKSGGSTPIACVPRPTGTILYEVYRAQLDAGNNETNVTKVCADIVDPVTTCADTPAAGHTYAYRVSAIVGALPETPKGGGTVVND